MALLLSPFFASALTCKAYFATVGGRPCGRPSFRAWAMPALTRSRRISRSNSAFCGEPQNADYAKRAVMQSHSAKVALWLGC